MKDIKKEELAYLKTSLGKVKNYLWGLLLRALSTYEKGLLDRKEGYPK